ncbi:hypothetical protein RF11_08394 [Thelohanellus kitauei]|uniref:Uncharacterized protein n=1 Tax=Thelohanellus kitauei TaxID=669202 RepID=A0A0C2IQ05_THEKT|nr:hypothetical protein RF11_08394 [Thelohanellus kitauei]
MARSANYRRNPTTLRGRINGVDGECINDTGAEISLVKYYLLENFKTFFTLHTIKDDIKTANDGKIDAADLRKTSHIGEAFFCHNFVVSRSLFCDCILGNDFQTNYKSIITFDDRLANKGSTTVLMTSHIKAQTKAGSERNPDEAQIINYDRLDPEIYYKWPKIFSP